MGASSASQNGRRAAVQAHAKSAAREPLHRLLLVAGSTQRSGAAYSLTFTATAASPGKSVVVPSERRIQAEAEWRRLKNVYVKLGVSSRKGLRDVLPTRGHAVAAA